MNVIDTFKDVLATALAKVPFEIAKGIVELVQRVASSPDPADMLARIAQVEAHDKGADAAIDALFEAKRRAVNVGE